MVTLNVTSQPRTLDQYLNDLERILGAMAEESVDGIKGVVRIDSGVPGPILGITACTHGNEPSGLAAIEHLLDVVMIRENLIQGTLYLVVNNLEAALQSLASRRLPASERKEQYRYLEKNMNRLPHNLLDEKCSGMSQPVEIRRARELAPIWAQFTHGLDIHSTKGDIAPMIITGLGGLRPDLVRGFPITKVLTEIHTVQIGSPVYGFFGSKSAADVPIVLEIEAGTHQDTKSFERASVCAEALLKNLGMIAGSTDAAVSQYEIYEMFDTIVFPNTTYELTRYFQDFEEVREGETIARSRGNMIVAATKCHTVFASQKLRPTDVAEEIMYLSRPMTLRKA